MNRLSYPFRRFGIEKQRDGSLAFFTFKTEGAALGAAPPKTIRIKSQT